MTNSERIVELEQQIYRLLEQLKAADAVAGAAWCFTDEDSVLGPDDCDYADLKRALAAYDKAKELKP